MLRVGTLVLALALAASACGEIDSGRSGEQSARQAAKTCPKEWRAGWQALADRVGTPVYCPTWITPPLTGEIRGPWNNIYSVDRRNRSYLVGFTWYEVGSGEVHVNFRGSPGSTKIPRCPGDPPGGTIPCFADRSGHKRVAGRDVSVFNANQGADKWHVLYAWERGGTLYTLSEHVAKPHTYRQVVGFLDRMMRGLVLVEPHAS